MAQWTNLQQIEKFVNPTQLYITYGKSGWLHLAEPGLMAVRQSGSMLDEIWMRYDIFKLVDQTIRFFVLFKKGAALFKHF